MPDLMRREIRIGSYKATVGLNNPVYRYPKNPILTCHDVNRLWKEPALQVKTVHNAGVAEYNGNVVLLFRSHLRSGRSVLGIARSSNGLDNWRVEPRPAMLPCSEDDLFAEGVNKTRLIENETGGIEDPRIVFLDGEYVITYNAYHASIRNRGRASLAVTKDFKSFTRLGPIANIEMRNIVLFPEEIKNRYAALFRLNDKRPGDIGGGYREIRVGYTDDWRSGRWKIQSKPIIRTAAGPNAMSDKIGPGATPIKTRYGWISIIHGVRNTMDGNPYVLGVALHDLEYPEKVCVSNIPILFPSRADCRVKEDDYIHVPNVVFTCGAIRRDNGTIIIYYGGNDTVLNIGATHEDILVRLCTDYCEIFI